jgi:hypothetical protein
MTPHQMLMDQIERTRYLGYLCIFLWLTVNPNIKLVRDYNYSGGCTGYVRRVTHDESADAVG